MESAAPRPLISVILPVYQTAIYLRELYQRSRAALEPLGDFELLMVDDGSRDNAWEIIQELAAQDARVKGMKLSRNFGQHPAISAGFEHAKGEVIVLMDADLQDRPEDIPRLYEQLKGDVDVVYTVKEGEREAFTYRLTSRLYHYVFSRLTGARVPPRVGTFRLFSRRFLDAVLSYPERNILFGPLMFHMGFQSATVAVQHVERAGSRSAYTFRKRLALAVNSLLNYTDLPHRLLVSMGSMILLGSGLYLVALLVKYIVARGNLPPGLTLLALLVTFSLGSVMLSLGILGTYVFRVYQEVLRRPRYIVARSLNLSSTRN